MFPDSLAIYGEGKWFAAPLFLCFTHHLALVLSLVSSGCDGTTPHRDDCEGFRGTEMGLVAYIGAFEEFTNLIGLDRGFEAYRLVSLQEV